MDEAEERFADEAEAAVRELMKRHTLAGPAERLELEPQIEMAIDRWRDARIELMKSGNSITEEDIEQMQVIRREIDQAADQQAIIVAAARLVTKFISII
ncbi:MAG: hypothetical protein ACFE0S_02680 [Rhodospirillales bacterium]